MAEHKVALVTGSGKKRLGWHVASALAGRGCAVVLHYHNSAQEAADSLAALRARGVPAHAVQADLGDEDAVGALFDETLRHFGRLDVLVNAAGLWRQRRLEDVSADDVRRHFDANVLGTFLCARRAGLIMVGQSEGGCIVNLGDWAEARPYLDYAAYFASKGAIGALTRCLAVELGTRNPRVRVNCVHPGPVLLPPDLPQEERQKAIASTLVQREGSPEDVAGAVLCLLDNDFITGACLTVDGGRTVYAGGS
jgi:pteridine reductase